MFRYFMMGSILFASAISLIVWAARPDLVEKDIRKPLAEWNAAREAELWKAAKEDAWREWAARIRLPGDCAALRTEVAKLECKNKWELHAKAFERNWSNKVSTGWKPDGVF